MQKEWEFLEYIYPLCNLAMAKERVFLTASVVSIPALHLLKAQVRGVSEQALLSLSCASKMKCLCMA